MSKRSKAQRAAEARYEIKRRGIAVTLRLTQAQAEWLAAEQQVGESRPATLKRLAGMPMWAQRLSSGGRASRVTCGASLCDNQPEDEMMRYHVWCPELDQKQGDGMTIEAVDAEAAVEEWAEFEDAYSADYWIIGGSEPIVNVRLESGGERRRYRVRGEQAAVYFADVV